MKNLNSIIMLFMLILVFSFPLKSSSSPINNYKVSTLAPISDIIDLVTDLLTIEYQLKKGKGWKKDDDHRGDDDDHWNDDDDDGNDIPLDGGLSFLAIAGAGLGVKKVVEHRNRKRDNK